MSSDTIPSDTLFSDEPIAEPARGNGKIDRWLKILFVVVVILLAAEFIWLFAVKISMPLATVEVRGIPDLDKAAVLAQGGIDYRSSFMTVKPRMVEKALAEMYQVESARVIKHYPDGLEIILNPRKAVAVSLFCIDQRVFPVYIDKQGMIIKIGNVGETDTPSPGLPLVSGLFTELPGLGSRLPPRLEPLFFRLEQLKVSAPELLAAISEIRINEKAYDGFDLVVYPMYNPIRFRFEAELNEDMLRYMLLMIDVLVSRGVTVDEVDLRTGTASYVVKEASSG
ncbi:MAG: FtsQ-type POTRA domain-containing protein [Spirochaetaceae bacterium]|jgi:cell division protein FtsQ|nr:FtsQ-type POTRA domain-containing protein [Spirochaetaceae bacterium]